MKVIEQLIESYPDLMDCKADFLKALDLIINSYRGGGKVLVCGNGGSASDALHIVGELMKGFMSLRPLPLKDRQKLLSKNPAEGEFLANHLQGALPAVSLVSETSLISAYANDVDPQMTFAQQVYGLGRPGDVLIAISASGNSVSILNASRVAQSFDLHTIGLSGPTGGMLKSICDITICAPGDSIPEVQERHLPIYHALCLALEQEFFPE